MKDRWQHLTVAQSVEWPTPPALYELLHQEFRFTLDPCPLGGSDDGLSTLFKSWDGQRVFVNPPYGPKLWRWFQRAPEAELAVFLTPARTDTRAFHQYCMRAHEIRFIRGRLKFGQAEASAPFASMVVIFENGFSENGPAIRSLVLPQGS